MPHLSPMNWMSTISLITLLIMLLTSSYWWMQPQKFNSSFKQLHKIKSKWFW